VCVCVYIYIYVADHIYTKFRFAPWHNFRCYPDVFLDGLRLTALNLSQVIFFVHGEDSKRTLP